MKVREDTHLSEVRSSAGELYRTCSMQKPSNAKTNPTTEVRGDTHLLFKKLMKRRKNTSIYRYFIIGE